MSLCQGNDSLSVIPPAPSPSLEVTPQAQLKLSRCFARTVRKPGSG